jgi:hypothetical protein
MFVDLNQRLADAKERLIKQQKLQRHLASAQQSLEQEQIRLAKLDAKLQSEDLDVKKLEGLSLTSLFYKVLGSQEKQLEKERQEYLSAKLKYHQCNFAVSNLTQEVASLRGELARLGDVETRYQSVLSEKEKLIQQSGGLVSRELLEISDRITNAQSEYREVGEAIDAGNEVLKYLQQVIDAMQSAGNWGVWDMFGGGLLTTAAKHSRIDDARDAAYLVQERLRRFERELGDVSQTAEGFFVDLSSFETFADYFFDGLIADWIVQSKIERSLENSKAVYRQIVQILERLNRKLAEVRSRLDEMKAAKNRLVEEVS